LNMKIVFLFSADGVDHAFYNTLPPCRD